MKGSSNAPEFVRLLVSISKVNSITPSVSKSSLSNKAAVAVAADIVTSVRWCWYWFNPESPSFISILENDAVIGVPVKVEPDT